MQQYGPSQLPLSPWQLLRALSWRGVALVALGATLAITLLIVVGFVFLLIFPILLLVGLIGRWFGSRRPATPPPPMQRRPSSDILDGSYEVIEIERSREVRPGQRRETPWG